MKIVLTLLALAVACSVLQTWRLSESQAAEAKLRSTVQVLEVTLDRNSRATAVHRKALVQAQAKALAASQALERALAASPEWSATPVPREIQDAP
jgi:hypothetical protein